MLHMGRLSCATASGRGSLPSVLAHSQPLGVGITDHRHPVSAVVSIVWKQSRLPLARLAAGSCGRRIMPDVAACVTFASRLVLRADLRTCVLSSARAQMQGVSLGTGRGRPAAGQCVLPLTRLRAHVPGQQADRRLSRRECVDGKCVACEGILADRFECMPHSQKWGFLFDLAELAAPCRETPCNQLPCITFISLRPARRDVGIDAPEEFGGAEP